MTSIKSLQADEAIALVEQISRMTYTSDADDAIDTVNGLIERAKEVLQPGNPKAAVPVRTKSISVTILRNATVRETAVVEVDIHTGDTLDAIIERADAVATEGCLWEDFDFLGGDEADEFSHNSEEEIHELLRELDEPE